MKRYTQLKVAAVEKFGSLAWIRAMHDGDASGFCPGVFVLLWVPGFEAIPMSVSWLDEYGVEFIVRPVGPTTNRLYNVVRGDVLGMIGPLGRCANRLLRGASRALLVGGGSGVAPLPWLAASLVGKGVDVVTVLGVRDGEEAGIRKVFEMHGVEVVVACEKAGEDCDRSGLAVDRWLYELGDFDVVVASGPMGMLRAAYRLFRDKLVVFLERRVVCGLGFCGACRVKPGGPLLCRDGPAFPAAEVKEVLEGVTSSSRAGS